MKSSLIEIVIAISLCACTSPGQDYNIIIDSKLPLAWQQASVDGSQAWLDVLSIGKLPLKLTTVIGGDCTGSSNEICIVASTSQGIVDIGGSAAMLASTSRNGMNQHSDIYIALDKVPNLSQIYMGQSIAHELGHAMALGHTQADTLMCASIGCEEGNVRPTCNDIDQYMNIRGITQWSLPECPYGGSYHFEN